MRQERIYDEVIEISEVIARARRGEEEGRLTYGNFYEIL